MTDTSKAAVDDMVKTLTERWGLSWQTQFRAASMLREMQAARYAHCYRVTILPGKTVTYDYPAGTFSGSEGVDYIIHKTREDFEAYQREQAGPA